MASTKTGNTPVDHPAHYNKGEIETIEVIEDMGIEIARGFCLGNAIKYIQRAQHKDRELQDLKKAQWYLNRFISFLENKNVK